MFRDLIWKGGQPRISLQTLQLSTREGGMAVPHPRSYFLAAQLQHLGMGPPDLEGDINRGLMIEGAPRKTLTEVLEANSFILRTPTVKLTINVWKTVEAMKGMGGMTKCTPLWNNKNLRELEPIGKIKTWEIKGIDRLAQLYNGSILKTFSSLKEEYDIPNHSFYKYLHIRHALNTQFGRQGPIWSNSPIYQRIGRSGGSSGFIAETYT